MVTYRGQQLILSAFSPLSKGGNPNFEIFKKGVGEPEKVFWGGGNQKGGKIFKNKGGTQLFKLNLGIVKDKNEDF